MTSPTRRGDHKGLTTVAGLARLLHNVRPGIDVRSSSSFYNLAERRQLTLSSLFAKSVSSSSHYCPVIPDVDEHSLPSPLLLMAKLTWPCRSRRNIWSVHPLPSGRPQSKLIPTSPEPAQDTPWRDHCKLGRPWWLSSCGIQWLVQHGCFNRHQWSAFLGRIPRLSSHLARYHLTRYAVTYLRSGGKELDDVHIKAVCDKSMTGNEPWILGRRILTGSSQWGRQWPSTPSPSIIEGATCLPEEAIPSKSGEPHHTDSGPVLIACYQTHRPGG